ncbi:MAG: hypothetical protein AB2693_23650 [Candidatus Thiodiazotropha sp.]
MQWKTRLQLERLLPPAGIEPETAISVGQHFTHCATGAPYNVNVGLKTGNRK